MGVIFNLYAQLLVSSIFNQSICVKIYFSILRHLIFNLHQNTRGAPLTDAGSVSGEYMYIYKDKLYDMDE